MYRQDSFFDLWASGQAGLAALSALLYLLTLFAAWRLLPRRPVWMRLVGALVIFWIFLWLSPQIYYQYYHLLIPNLPAQWVIWPPRPPQEALGLLVLHGPWSLAAHGQALLGWSLIAIAILRLSPGRRWTCR